MFPLGIEGVCVCLLCLRTNSVVFRGCTGIYTGLDRGGVGCWLSPLG